MAAANTIRRYEIKTDDNGLISIPIDVCRSDGSMLERRSFHISTAEGGCTMRAADLKALGYDVSAAAAVGFIRIGVYDFFNISFEIADANIIGSNLLRWLNFSISNSESAFDVDLIERLKLIVEKGINPNIKPGSQSRIKGSEHNDNGNWLTWEEIDSSFPNSWVVLAADNNDEEIDLGGEVLWQSEDEIPDTSQENTFIYCNKSIAEKKPFSVAFEDYVRCRGFAKADQNYTVSVEELEAKLAPPKANRFYYDTVSKQGKLYMVRKASQHAGDVNPNAVLSQADIDALFAEYGVE